ncbi:MAG: hypothetical protein L6Q84_14075 [Polyangiaceae bacterium]|nr:hypothetical protein [Polyangiaceae bacterium]
MADSNAPSPSDANAHRIEWARRLLLALSAALVALLGYQVALRVRFPWDTFIWSESPFMTNLMKLSAGESIYQPADAANSFVYAPGLELLCFGLLRPLGLALDVRACRVVVVALGVLAAACGALFVARVVAQAESAAKARRAAVIGAFFVTCLVLFKNFTADVCHPDNLHVLHATGTLALLAWALDSKSLRVAAATLVVASLGALTKQYAGGAVLGVLGALFALVPEFRRPARRWALIAIAACALGAVVALLLRTPSARFWLIEVPSRHAYLPSKLDALTSDVMRVPHRVLLWALTPYAAVSLYLSGDRRVRTLAAAWVAVGAVEVVPAFLGYFKWMGLWNNLGIVDVWALLVVLPVLMASASAALSKPSFALGASFLIVLSSIPCRLPPGPEQYAFGRAIDGVARDARARNEVLLVAHGTSYLLHAGMLEPPRDRMNTLLELVEAELPLPSTALARIREAKYDRIVVHSLPWYGAFSAAINESYQVERVIPPPAEHAVQRSYPRYDLAFGFQPDLNSASVRVMVPKRQR